MPRAENEPTLKEIKKSLHVKNVRRKSGIKRAKSKLKPKSHKKDNGSTVLQKKIIKYVRRGLKNGCPRSVVNKLVHKTKSSRTRGFSSCKSEHSLNISFKGKQKCTSMVNKSKKLKRRKKRRPEDNRELDEASRLQRRTRYLLIKIKQEQNLIDAYSGEGWKGQSREKIKPEKELLRAQKQILKCKLGIRDAIHQIDLLSTVGRVDDTITAEGESVHHERIFTQIFCIKCKSLEVSPDNDIIPCDGACKCAFHQKCIDPPLLILQKEGWFCKFCDCKREILEAMNAHLGTNFPVNGYWQDIFKEEAALPDGEDFFLHAKEEWPSDDSEDDDYDPEKLENSGNYSKAGSEDASSLSSWWSVEGELCFESERLEIISKGCQNMLSELNSGVNSDEASNCGTLSGRRQRKEIDYIKLDEMLEKDTFAMDQVSDEDWLPSKRRRKEKESDAANTLVTLSENEKGHLTMNEEKKTPLSRLTKRPFFRIPPPAVEKLRLVFSENELPSKAVKENLSEQLGLESSKVNKWFKNARYLALKARKEHMEAPSSPEGFIIPEEFESFIEREMITDYQASKTVSSTNVGKKQKTLKKFYTRKKGRPLASSRKNLHDGTSLRSLSQKKAAFEFGDDVSLKIIREKAKRERKKVDIKLADGLEEVEAQMEILCKIKDKVERLQQVLQGLSASKYNTTVPTSNDSSIIYVPVAELREKR